MQTLGQDPSTADWIAEQVGTDRVAEDEDAGEVGKLRLKTRSGTAGWIGKGGCTFPPAALWGAGGALKEPPWRRSREGPGGTCETKARRPFVRCCGQDDVIVEVIFSHDGGGRAAGAPGAPAGGSEGSSGSNTASLSNGLRGTGLAAVRSAWEAARTKSGRGLAQRASSALPRNKADVTPAAAGRRKRPCAQPSLPQHLHSNPHAAPDG